jgi:hypothetical protein
MRSKHLVFLGLIAGLAGFACGGSDDDDAGNGDGPMCRDSSCGGKLDGTWKLSEACYVVVSQPDLPMCAGAKAELHARMVEGSLTVEGDTYERHSVIQTELILKRPPACQGEGDKKTACNELGGTLSNGARLICADADNAADGCECTTTVETTVNDSGQLTIRGNRVSFVGEDLDYCVKDGKLTLQQSKAINMSGTPVTSQLQTSYERN